MSGELPHDAWYSYVQELLRDTTGLASSYFLTTEATQAFAEIMGATHATGPGTVRTYLPDADPASDLDALRHRILGTERILRYSGRRLRSEEHTSELQSLMRISYAVFSLKKKKN